MIEEILKDKERVITRKASLFPGLICVVVGVSLSGLAYSDIVPEGCVSELLMTAGLVFTLVGTIKLCLRGDNYYDRESGCRLKYFQIYYDHKELGRIESLFQSRDYAGISEVKVSPQGGVALHICGTTEGSLYYLLLMKYVPFQFVPISEVVELTQPNDVRQIADLLDNHC